MADEIVIPLRLAWQNLNALEGDGVTVNGRLRFVSGADGVYALHVEGPGFSPFPVEGEAPGE